MATVRVYELAAQLHVESKVVLGICKDLGLFVRSAASVVQPQIEPQVRDAVGRLDKQRGVSSPRATDQQPQLPRQFQCVDESVPKARTDRVWRPRTLDGSPPRPKTLEELMADPLPLRTRTTKSRRPRSVPQSKQRVADDKSWMEELFEPVERDAWRSAGIYDARMAGACRSKGLTPEDMSEKVGGRRIGESLAGGVKLSVILATRREERERAASGQ